MGPMIFSPDIERAQYNRVRNFMSKNNPGVDFIINQSDLRLEKAADPTAGTYKFDIYENKASDRPQEQKLNRNDLFFISHLALCVTKQDETLSPKRYGNFPLLTFPDPNYFLANDTVNAEEWQALENIWNGRIDLLTSTVKRINHLLTHNLRFAPETQVLTKGSGATPTNQNINDTYPQYGPDHAGRGYFRLNPMVILDGQENNSFELEIGSGDRVQISGLVDESNAAVTTRNVIVLLLKGFLVNNGAQKVGRWTAV